MAEAAVGRTSCLLIQEVGEGVEEGHLGATGAGLQGEVVPWTGCPWAVEAGPQRLQAVGAAAMEGGWRCQGWTWWWCSVARVEANWWPCCWLEGEVELVVAMVAGVQKGEEVAGYWEGEVEVASCPLVEGADPLGVREVLDPGPWGEEGAASRGEAYHWG